jgi:hypothetical protein
VTVEVERKLVPFTASVCAAPPAEAEDGERLVSVGVGLPQVPVRATVCGLPAALSDALRVALRVPLAEGVKVTLMGHVASAATELPHVLVSAKSPALAPVSMMLVMLSGAPPLFVIVTAWALLVVPSDWLANVKLAGDKTAVAAATPVPDSEILRLEPPQLNDMCPVALPPDAGVNTTLKVVLPFAPSVRGNTSPLVLKPVPVSVSRDTVTLRDPSFLRVSLRERLVPTATLPKLKLLLLAAICVDAFASRASPRTATKRSKATTRLAKGVAHEQFREFSGRHR